MVLGHAHSTYWGKKPELKADMYRTKCMNSLTFLDFSRLEAISKNVDVRIDAKDKEIQILMQRESSNEEKIKILMEALKGIQEDVEELENSAKYGGGGWFQESVVGKVDDLRSRVKGENQLCVCGHVRGQHQILLPESIRYYCLQCPCTNFITQKD